MATSSALVNLLRALEDGEKFDKYNKPFLDAVLTEAGLTMAQVRARAPLIPFPYDPLYKRILLDALDYEFSNISIENIKRVAEECNYDCAKSRARLRTDEVPKMRGARNAMFPGGFHTTLGKEIHPVLKAYIRELKLNDDLDREARMHDFTEAFKKAGLGGAGSGGGTSGAGSGGGSSGAPASTPTILAHYRRLLGVTSTASAEDIRAAYKAKALKYHPDRNNGDKDLFDAIKVAHDELLKVTRA